MATYRRRSPWADSSRAPALAGDCLDDSGGGSLDVPKSIHDGTIRNRNDTAGMRHALRRALLRAVWCLVSLRSLETSRPEDGIIQSARSRPHSRVRTFSAHVRVPGTDDCFDAEEALARVPRLIGADAHRLHRTSPPGRGSPAECTCARGALIGRSMDESRTLTR